jgi:hypothetical protein
MGFDPYTKYKVPRGKCGIVEGDIFCASEQIFASRPPTKTQNPPSAVSVLDAGFNGMT